MKRMLTGLALMVVLVLAAPPALSATDDGKRVEVIEFFWYGCPHCYRFQPHLAQWAQQHADGIEITHVPVVLNPGWEVHARAFYTAHLLEGLEDFHFAFYRAIHEDGNRLDQPDDIAEFAGTLGMDEERFLATMDSFAVDNRIQAAQRLQREYRVSGTPSVGIDGRTVSPSEAGSMANMLEMMDEHVRNARDGGN